MRQICCIFCADRRFSHNLCMWLSIGWQDLLSEHRVCMCSALQSISWYDLFVITVLAHWSSCGEFSAVKHNRHTLQVSLVGSTLYSTHWGTHWNCFPRKTKAELSNFLFPCRVRWSSGPLRPSHGTWWLWHASRGGPEGSRHTLLD